MIPPNHLLTKTFQQQLTTDNKKLITDNTVTYN